MFNFAVQPEQVQFSLLVPASLFLSSFGSCKGSTLEVFRSRVDGTSQACLVRGSAGTERDELSLRLSRLLQLYPAARGFTSHAESHDMSGILQLCSSMRSISRSFFLNLAACGTFRAHALKASLLLWLPGPPCLFFGCSLGPVEGRMSQQRSACSFQRRIGLSSLGSAASLDHAPVCQPTVSVSSPVAELVLRPCRLRTAFHRGPRPSDRCDVTTFGAVGFAGQGPGSKAASAVSACSLPSLHWAGTGSRCCLDGSQLQPD